MALEAQSALPTLLDALTAAEDDQLMRRLLQGALQALIEAEAEHHIGAGLHERTATRTTHRNGTRDRLVATTAGNLNIKIPKTRTGSFFPTLLHPRRRIDRALHAVVMEAYVHGVSTRKVDDLVEALGVESGISKSEVSRICADLDAEVEAFRSRPLDVQRLNREVKRRTDVVDIFPNAKALLRLAGCVLIEAHDESQSRERRYLSESSMALLTPPEPTVLPAPALRADAATGAALDTATALTA